MNSVFPISGVREFVEFDRKWSIVESDDFEDVRDQPEIWKDCQ